MRANFTRRKNAKRDDRHALRLRHQGWPGRHGGADLPDCGPLVSFETTVGRALKPGEIIDVDIEAIYETAAAVGLNEREMKARQAEKLNTSNILKFNSN